ncbi:MAG: hypothetical protein AB9873_08105 [Syntrophobacteraceae bacterium]
MKGQGAYIPNATSPDNASPLNAAVAFIMPVVWVNCEDGDGTCQIDAVFLDVLPENADQLAESETKEWAAESGATVGAVVGSTLKDDQGTVVEAEGILNANQRWEDIGAGTGFTGTQAVSALSVDISTIPNNGCAGRIGTFPMEVAQLEGQPFTTIGLYFTLDPADGVMRRGSISDGSCTFFAGLNLGTTSPSSFALPGAIVRNDAWSFLPGKDVYLSWQYAGNLTQQDPPDGIPRFKIGQAIASNLMYFDPDSHYAADLGGFVSVPAISLNEPLASIGAIIFWNGALYAGTNNGKIRRSTDYGLTFTTVYDLGTAYGFISFEPFGAFLYACANHTPGFVLARSNNGINWGTSHINGTGDRYVPHMQVFSSLLMVGSFGSGYAKIWTTTDGITLTLRYTSPTEGIFCKFGVNGGYALALIGGTTARALSSPAGTAWTIRSSYTGYPVPVTLFVHNNGTTETSYAVAADAGWSNGIMYSGTGALLGTLEFDPPGCPNGFIVIDNEIYLCGGDESGSGLYKRNGAANWSIYARNVAIGGCFQFLLADNGYIYFLDMNGLRKIPRPHLLAI